MIKSLYIKNLAIIDELEVHFENGLNIITGETGSGKSILVNAISYLLPPFNLCELIINLKQDFNVLYA